MLPLSKKSVASPPFITALPMVILQGPRLMLRPPQSADANAWIEVRERNRRYLKEYEPTWPTARFTPEFYSQRLTRQVAEWRLDRTRPFFIFDAQDTLIGGVNINNICRGAAQFASLGYWLDEAAQGQGFMAEALHLIAAYSFGDAGLHRLNASCLPGNFRSRHLLLKCGFKEEGFAEKYLEIDGQWQDHVLFGLTIERWQGSSVPGIHR